MPQDMCDAKTLYNKKGARSDCNNHRGIFLLSIAGKTFSRVILPRLKKFAERVYSESQCEFRSQRSTTDIIFSVRQLQEKFKEQNVPFYIAFIDLDKAFNLVSNKGLFAVLLKIGCHPILFNIEKSSHGNTKANVLYDGNVFQLFTIKSGVNQGCVIAQLFSEFCFLCC